MLPNRLQDANVQSCEAAAGLISAAIASRTLPAQGPDDQASDGGGSLQHAGLACVRAMARLTAAESCCCSLFFLFFFVLFFLRSSLFLFHVSKLPFQQTLVER